MNPSDFNKIEYVLLWTIQKNIFEAARARRRDQSCQLIYWSICSQWPERIFLTVSTTRETLAVNSPFVSPLSSSRRTDRRPVRRAVLWWQLLTKWGPSSYWFPSFGWISTTVAPSGANITYTVLIQNNECHQFTNVAETSTMWTDDDVGIKMFPGHWKKGFLRIKNNHASVSVRKGYRLKQSVVIE